MKKIENKYEEKVIRTTVTYEAADGAIFYSEDECKEYEKSAKCAIFGALRDLAGGDGPVNGYTMFPGGNDDNAVYVVTPKTDDDIKAIRTVEAYVNQKYNDKWDAADSSVRSDMKGQRLVVVLGYDNDWIEIRTVESVIALLMGE